MTETDPTCIDWAARQAAAAIPFQVVDGHPVNPFGPTGVRYGRGELEHWGEALAADALVTATNPAGRWILMVERSDGHGWAIPGGHVDPGETPTEAAVRELEEETGLTLLPGVQWHTGAPQYVPDPRASDQAWMVTVLCTADLGHVCELPDVVGSDDAAHAAWVRADTYDMLTGYLTTAHRGRVFAAHVAMLQDALHHAAPITLISFGYLHLPTGPDGAPIPPAADRIEDVRHRLHDPAAARDGEILDLDGRHPRVQEIVLNTRGAVELLDNLTDHAMRPAGPRSIAIGCAGGKHRACGLIEILGKELRGYGMTVRIEHQHAHLARVLTNHL